MRIHPSELISSQQMPLNLTPRRKGYKAPTPARLAEVGKHSGTYDNGSVLDRVRQWQERGGGVVTTPDIYYEEEEEYRSVAGDNVENACNQPAPKTRQSYGKPVTPNRHTPMVEPRTSDTHKRRSRREYSEEPTTHQQPQSASTPRRRIVSDSHWRAKRSPNGGHRDPSIKKSPPPSWAMPDDGIRVRPMPSPEDSTLGRRTKETQRHSRPDLPDDGIRVYSTQPDVPSEIPNERLQDGDSRFFGETCTEDRMSFHSPTPSERDTRRRNSCNATMDEGVPSLNGDPNAGDTHGNRRSHRAHKPRAGVRFSEPEKEGKRSAKRLSKSGLLSNVFVESKKLFGRADIPPPEPRVPTIESWLNDTPDPFVDPPSCDPNGQTPEEVEFVPTPTSAETPAEPQFERQRTHRKTRRSSGDPNGIWDSLGTPEKRSTERRSRRHPESVSPATPSSRKDNDIREESRRSRATDTTTRRTKTSVDGTEPSSPSSLRRRGAHKKSHSPSKDRRSNLTALKSAFSVPSGQSPSALSSADSRYTAEAAENIAPLQPRTHNIDGNMPSLGRKLSTIASVDTHQASLVSRTYGSKSGDDMGKENKPISADIPPEALSTNGVDRRSSKSKITKHADLMSLLSQPNLNRGKSLRSARSIRTTRTKAEVMNLPEIMTELAKDEVSYMRELRTLVDGVIPVLLTSILSKSESAATVGMFSSKRGQNDPNATKPIYDMGIALERLKRAHKRLSVDRADLFLSWARSTQYIYWDYLQAWRLGFQDVVVNLAPADPTINKTRETASAIDDGLDRNESGDVVDSAGERVDVAFLLKRPLVRLKSLSRTIRSMNAVDPSTNAAEMEKKYQGLLDEARNRVNEERARLEDEAAAAIDSTRARDLQTLAAREDVIVNDNLRVRARDCFNLTLNHTSCQVIDCRVELLLREDPKGKDHNGDVLICEVDGTGRWLLFPPVSTDKVSARNGDHKGEIVVMIRGIQDGNEWHELLCLRSDEEETGFEWVQMLGLVPIPPGVQRSRSFLEQQEKTETRKIEAPGLRPSSLPQETIDVPLGEHAKGRKRTNSNAKGENLRLPERTKLQKAPPAGDTVAGDGLKLPVRQPKRLEQDQSLGGKLRKSMPVGIGVQDQLSVGSKSPSQEHQSDGQASHSATSSLEMGGESTPKKHRSNSPLKKEYEPSTASESSSESDDSSVRQDMSSASDSDAELEDGDVAMPLLPPGALNRLKSGPGARNTSTGHHGTLAPSDSASQAPYKNVPQQPGQANKTIASIFYWSNKGAWESMHPDECSIVVTPGLIEAFEMSALHSKIRNNGFGEDSSNPSSRASSANPQPLVGLELTPLVPIRRGTALDISVRSPPTAESKIKQIQNANIMFRSRNPEECEALYALINHARINNPTYIALQNARATSLSKPFGGASFDGSKTGSRSSWFGFGASNRSSYRASSAPTPSAARQSDSSTGSASSAFATLRKIGMRSSRFSIARSTIISRALDGSRHSGSVFSSSEQSSSSGTSTPLPAGIAAAMGAVDAQNVGGAAPIGLSNAKIRLYIRETTSKWRDLGAARLTIMRPSGEGDETASSADPKAPPNAPLSQAGSGAAAEPALRAPGSGKPSTSDKRVVVTSKKTGETLLDVTLGESCFERVARTGIAVSVWETLHEGQVGDKGGVVGGRFRVYMVQMQSEAETAYTFGIVGRFRY